MALIAADSGGTFKPIPQGVHMARCYRVIDLGTQEVEWEGDKKLQHKVLIAWELHGEAEDGSALTQDDGKPMSISKRYTMSLGRNARLRADLEAWRGRAFTDEELRGFDVSKLIDAFCMLNVTHNSRDGKTYSNIASISPVPAMLRNAKPAGIMPAEVFDATAPDMTMFGTFHEKLQEVIRNSYEWRARNVQSGTQAKATAGGYDDMDSEIPF